MNKFLGLPLVRKPLTDSEFVERARRDVKRWQHYGKWLLLFQTAIIIAWTYFIIFLVHMLDKMGRFAGGQAGNLALGGLVVGLLVGFAFGVPISRALDDWGKTIGALRGDRTSVLLVKYHDAIIELSRKKEDHTELSASESRAGQGRGEAE